MCPVTSVRSQLSDLVDADKDKNRLNYAAESYKNAWGTEFSLERDVNHIYGEENIFRYLPLKSIGLRVQENDDLCDILLILLAVTIAKTPVTVSISGSDSKLQAVEKAALTLLGIVIKMQDEDRFVEEMDNYERIRICSPAASDAIYLKAAKLGKHIANNKPLAEGRLEMLHYLKEQSIAYEYHRYGSIFGDDK